jgi:hypothetical protein
MKLFPFLAAAALYAVPVQADTVKAYCVYSHRDFTHWPFGKRDVAMTGPCTVSQFGTNTGAMGATNYVTLEDGTELSYDGRKQGIDFKRTQHEAGFFLERDDDYLSVFWEKPAHEPAGW